MQVCIETKVQHIVAAYESDAQIAFMLQHGHAGLAVTEDSDLLAYGCKRVCISLTREIICWFGCNAWTPCQIELWSGILINISGHSGGVLFVV